MAGSSKKSFAWLLILVLVFFGFFGLKVLADQTGDKFGSSATGTVSGGAASDALTLNNAGPSLDWDKNDWVKVQGFSSSGVSGTINFVRVKVTVRTDSTDPRGDWVLRYTYNNTDNFTTAGQGYTAFDWHRTLSTSFVTETVDLTTRDGSARWTTTDIDNLRFRMDTRRSASGASGQFIIPDAIYILVDYTPPDTTPPTDPSNLRSTGKGGSYIDLAWDASSDSGSGVAGYQVYRNDVAVAWVAAPTTTYRDSGLAEFTTYSYKVSAKDNAGNWSTGYAGPISEQTLDTTAPSAVSSVTITAYSAYRLRELDITWLPSSDPSPGSGVSHYQIFDAGTNVLLQTYTHSGSVSSFTYRTSGLGYLPNQTRTYYFKTFDNSGNSSTSGNFSGTTDPDTLAPTPVNTLTAVAESSSRIRLDWDPVTDDWGVSHYMVYRNTVYLRRIDSTGATHYQIFDTGLNADTSYSYYVQPVDIYSNVQTSGNNTASATTFPVDTTPPSKPGNLTASAVGTSEIDLSWTASTDNVGVVGYYIYRSVSGGTYSYRATAAGTSYTDTGLTHNTLYGYYVRAYDEAGNISDPSDTASATTKTDTTPPSVVSTSPSAGANNVGRAVYPSANFSEALDANTVNSTNVVLKDVYDNTVTSGVYLINNSTVEIRPNARLAASTLHTVYLKTGIKDLAGLSMSSEYSWSFTTGTSDYFVPHGNYGQTPNACINCHSSHYGQNARMIRAANVSSVCFTCHNGTGAKALNDIDNQFKTGTNTVFHPVKNTQASAGGAYTGLIECVTCHNPHGDVNTVTGQVYPRLLKQKNASGNYVFQGNAFCLTCHGPTDRQWSATYYSNTAGDHSSASTKHYDLNEADLVPPSGTQITCVMCHNKHASPYRRLGLALEENLCFNCHNKVANSIDGNRNIQDEFNRTGSKHDIGANGSGGIRVECYNCHNTHLVTNVRVSAKQSVSDVTNPDNTKQYFTDTVSGKITGFCLKCHDGSPPVAVVNSTTLVPYTVTFPNVSFTNNLGGWDKSLFTDSGHHVNSTVYVDCGSCHEPHGSNYDRLRLRDEDTATTNGICLTCHAGQYANSVAPNVKTDLTKAYRHPTLYIAGVHTDTENHNFNTATNRHAECYDCHDMHAAKQGGAVAASGNTPPKASNILRNVYGISVTTDPNVRTVASMGYKPASMAYNSSGYSVTSVVYMFNLCYKCHSSYSFGNTPPTTPNPPYTDIAAEFNPNNESYHPIEAKGKAWSSIPNTSFTGTDSFGTAITRDTILFCTDCHGSNNSGVKGPHGSDNRSILKKPWTTTTGGNSTDFCFNCHNPDVYGPNATAGYTSTGFNDADTRRGNLHKYHGADKGYRNCQYCHVRIVHGWTRPHLIGHQDDPFPYIDKDGNGNATVNRITYFPPYVASGGYRRGGPWCSVSHGQH